MNTNTTTGDKSLSVVAVLTMFVGGLLFGYGLLLVPTSVLGGGWITAIGLSLLLSGLFATEWVGDRVGLSAANQRTLSLAFALLAIVLLIAFVAINFMSFEFAETSS